MRRNSSKISAKLVGVAVLVWTLTSCSPDQQAVVGYKNVGVDAKGDTSILGDGVGGDDTVAVDTDSADSLADVPDVQPPIACKVDSDCAKGQKCNIATNWCMAQSCNPGEHLCVGPYAATCNSDGSTAVDFQLCPDNAPCENGFCAKKGCGDGLCSPGETCATCPGDCGTCPKPLCGDGKCSKDSGENCQNCQSDCGPCGQVCGDGVCNGAESCLNCASDCGKCQDKCGDGVCGASESCNTCGQDCGKCPPTCGDLFCDPKMGETCKNCQMDCGPCQPTCGDGSCSGNESCTSCPNDCGPCPASCGNSKCESMLGENCSNCGIDCGPCPGLCGDGLCSSDAGESCTSCPADCGPCVKPFCGDKKCDTNSGENCTSCSADCGPCKPGSCVNNCGGKSDMCLCIPECQQMGNCCPDYQIFCPQTAVCGDGQCSSSAGESCSNCPKDCGNCGPVCGNAICEPGEACTNCPKDCACPTTCGNAVCELSENCQSCPKDCGTCGPVCGNGQCESSETCGNCAGDCGPCKPLCGNGNCEPAEQCGQCAPDCGFCTKCGDGYCGAGEDCSSCAQDCGKCNPDCGNGQCGSGETCSNCPNDCGKCPFCGDQVCDAKTENCGNCAKDCGSCSDGCTQSPTPTCGNCKCQDCVCQKDSFCCQTAWDNLCVSECAQCGVPCAGVPVCGDQQCNNGENCQGCPQDCGECPVTCGDGQCSSGESCSSCPNDCGPCMPVCGDKVCAVASPFAPGETCSTCPLDCGPCPFGCGDGLCGPSIDGSKETCATCPTDCGPCKFGCGDGMCGPSPDGTVENCKTCPTDCGKCQVCGDGLCTASIGETCSSCPMDCGKCNSCGDGVCAFDANGAPETCKSCPVDCGKCNPCGDGVCASSESCASCPMDCGPCPCVPKCEGKQCGSDACGGQCPSVCLPGQTCTFTGVCVTPPPTCGDAVCQPSAGENCKICPQDCGDCPAVCGDGSCSGTESCSTCPNDCGACQPKCGDKLCQASSGETCGNCPLDCGSCPAKCGDGVCAAASGETCGNCPGDCGKCPCIGTCSGKMCGDDGCGNPCGPGCPAGLLCQKNQCFPGKCVMDYDCNDSNPCTADVCSGAVCYNKAIVPCCASDLDGDGICDNVDNCAKFPNADQADMDADGVGDVCDPDIDGDGFANAQDCAPKDASKPAAIDVPCNGIDDNCNGQTDEGAVAVWQFDEGTNSGWSMDPAQNGVGWQVWANGKAKTGAGALWFGNPATGNYNNGAVVTGMARSPQFVLPPMGQITLSFAVFFDTEKGASYDKFWLEVSTGGGLYNDWTAVYSKDDTTATAAWVQGFADLSKYAGQTIRLRAHFDSGDGVANDTSGVWLDSVAVWTAYPKSLDMDGDGKVNACDPDQDGDGVPDTNDMCPVLPNKLVKSVDTDGDGIDDSCDPDDDNDGIPDEKDNCSLVVNPDQKDSNGNGLGDACDATTPVGPKSLPFADKFDGYKTALSEGGWNNQLVVATSASWALATDATGNKYAQLAGSPVSSQPTMTFAARLATPQLDTGTATMLKVAADVNLVLPPIMPPFPGAGVSVSVQVSVDGVNWATYQTIQLTGGKQTLSVLVGPTSGGKLYIGFLANGSNLLLSTQLTIDNVYIAN